MKALLIILRVFLTIFALAFLSVGVESLVSDLAVAIISLLIGAAILFFTWRKFIKKTLAKRANKETTPAVAPQVTVQPVKETPVSVAHEQPEPQQLVIPSKISGTKVSYKYDDVKIFTPEDLADGIDFPAIPLAEKVQLVQEPENTYDRNAVAVYRGNQKIGYLRKGKIQEMANDFLKNSWTIFAAIQTIDDDERKIGLALAFYKPHIITGEVKTFKLTGNRNQSMQDAIGLVDEGDEVSYSYDAETEKYIASVADDIGYFPKSADRWLEDDPVVVVSSIEEDENGKYTVFVDIEVSE